MCLGTVGRAKVAADAEPFDIPPRIIKIVKRRTTLQACLNFFAMETRR